MKILMISSYLPYPLFSGGHIRLYNLLKYLSRSNEITLICEKRPYQGQPDIERVKQVAKKVITVDRKKQWTVGNILKSFFSTNPFLLVGHDNLKMKEEIVKELAAQDYDLIHVETFYVMQNLPKTDIPVVLVEHNIEYDVYKRFVKNSNIFLKPLLYWDVLKIRIKEKMFWKKAKKLVAVSKQDAEVMGKDTMVVPNGVDIERYTRIEKEKIGRKLLFIGDFKWVQNRDAVSWLIKRVWPKLLKEFSSSKNSPLFWIVGKNIPNYFKKINAPSIVFDENAPSATEQIYHEADLLVAPIRVGGGTSFKILEAMAVGLPVVTTPLGNQGISAKSGREILIAERSDDFIQEIKNILSDKKMYDEISKNSSEFMRKNYDWKNIVKKLEKVYKETI